MYLLISKSQLTEVMIQHFKHSKLKKIPISKIPNITKTCGNLEMIIVIK